MKTRIFLLLATFLLSCVCPLLSQNIIIEGTVVDSEDKRPIQGAIITYGIGKTQAKTTDANGKFSIPGDASGYPIQVQCLGYETTSITMSALKKQKVIALKLSPFSLAPVEISADAAQRFVQKAIYNTKNKMVINKYLIYMTHINETEYLTKEKRDFYFKYAALQKKRKPKDDIIPVKLWLMNLRHIEIPPDTTQSFILKEKSGESQFHVHRITDNFDKRYVTILSSDDESVIKLESYPSSTSTSPLKNIYYINATDTTLISVQAESIESRIQKKSYSWNHNNNRNLKHKLLRMSSSIDFARDGEELYFSGSSYIYVYSYFIDDKEEIIISYMENKFMEMQDELDTKKKYKGIINNAKELYKTPDLINPETP